MLNSLICALEAHVRCEREREGENEKGEKGNRER